MSPPASQASPYKTRLRPGYLHPFFNFLNLARRNEWVTVPFSRARLRPAVDSRVHEVCTQPFLMAYQLQISSFIRHHSRVESLTL